MIILRIVKDVRRRAHFVDSSRWSFGRRVIAALSKVTPPRSEQSSPIASAFQSIRKSTITTMTDAPNGSRASTVLP